ncbi:MAG: hypothetical protein QXN71_00105 [Candidatus Aenigmatarchaeota archaeon]
MGLFRKKKSAIDRAQFRRIVMSQQRHKVYLPPYRSKPIISSREYRIFKQMEKRRLNWYERLAKFSENILTVKPGKRTEEELGSQIAFTGLRVTPASVMSLFVLTLVVFIVIGTAFTIALISNPVYGLTIIAIGLGLSYYFYKYPANLVKRLRMQASSEVVLAILYMVVSMRISPNLERALRFAAANISGALAWDMRRLLWDIEMRRYYSASDALTDYIAKWKPENEEFAESLRLIRDSETQVPERGMKILDEALDVILDGTKTRMKHYAQELNLPVMVIHMMGIVLPVLGTIMAPLAAVFMADVVSPLYFVIGYDIILPVVLIWFINNTLSKRPVTFSRVDISRHPNIPPKGKFWIGKGKSMHALPIAIIIFLAFVLPAAYFFLENPKLISIGLTDTERCTFFGNSYTKEDGVCPGISLAMSLFIILGFGISLSVYLILSTFQTLRVQQGVESIEGQFELALFQLGNRIRGGTPTELAMEKAIGDMKDIEISNLFRIALRNIKTLGMTFDEAFFNRNYGALRYYPSQLIKNIMYAIIDTSKKGVTYASEAMLRISRYLKNIRETQEYIREMLSETTSSMKFQAYFLTPLITGLIVSMADVMIQVLVALGSYLNSIAAPEGGIAGMDISKLFADTEKVISPSLFQLIVGVYVIEVIIILGIFMTKISHGENKILQWNIVGRMLLVGMFIYFLVAIISSTMFGGLIREALSGILGMETP